MAFQPIKASSRLYKEARLQFIQQAEARYQEPREREMLHEFLASNSTPEEAQAAANNLKMDAGSKYGERRVGDTEIPAEWIDKLMHNIGNFVAVGNYAMEGALESVGLAWFAVKLTLTAIQSNYNLYTLFGAGLMDISEIMVIVPHYDCLYDQRDHAEWRPSPMVDQLFQDIITTYVAVLSFSLSVKRHLSAGMMAKARHAFKDFFGASMAKFQEPLQKIAELKVNVLEKSKGIFQEKSLQHLGTVQGIVCKIESTVNDMRDFQSTLQEMLDQQSSQGQLVLRRLEDIKANTKPKTTWDFALQEFEKNKQALGPLKDTDDVLAKFIDQRYPGTCVWVFKNPLFTSWRDSTSKPLLSITGQQGSGKSIVIAAIVEQLGMNDDAKSVVLYLSCGSTGVGAPGQNAPSVDKVCHWLLYKLYQVACKDDTNVLLLEDCNKVFANTKGKKARTSLSRVNKDDELPDFVDAFMSIVHRLKVSVVIALDELDSLAAGDQQHLASKLQALLAPSLEPAPHSPPIKVLLGSRSQIKVHSQAAAADVSAGALDVGDHNGDDLERKLFDDLKIIPGLTPAEQDEAKRTIVARAGPRFAYVNNIAVPFMRQPFKRPLVQWLQALPKGMNNIYSEALRRMSPNYVGLLRTALTWAVLSPVPPRADEVMDAYHGSYCDAGGDVAVEARAAGFTGASELEIEQLRDASRPFLRIEQLASDGQYFVSLYDPPQVRDFCLHDDDSGAAESAHDDALCARCQSALSGSSTLTISPKQGHLEMALTCLRHLNNPLFQRLVTGDDINSEPKPEELAAKAGLGEQEKDNGAEAHGEQDREEPTAETGSGEQAEEDKEKFEDAVEEQVPKADTGDGLDKDSEYDSDDSMDDEDCGEFNLARAPQGDVEAAAPKDSSAEQRPRYEVLFFSYHLRKAEDLWKPKERKDHNTWAAVMAELDHLVTTSAVFFSQLQQFDEHTREIVLHVEPLYMAAFHGLVSWAEHLLGQGADPNAVSGVQRQNAVQAAACKADSPEMLRLLLERGADINAQTEECPPAFHRWLSGNAGLETTRLMLEHGADPSVGDKANGFTPLHYFLSGGSDVDILDLLLKNGAAINAVNNKSGQTPLHILLWRREVPKPLLQALVHYGADVNADDVYSCRPLQIAAQWGELDTLKILCEGRDAIANIDDDDNDGDTALHQAALNGHAQCITFFADRGADVNRANKRGRIALHDAAWQGFEDCVRVLLAHGAVVNAKDKHNRTPLFFACLGKSVETVQMLFDALLEHNVPVAEINAPTTRRRTPLRQAAAHGFEAVLERLIRTAQDAGTVADLLLDERDSRKGMTPLHRAAWHGQASSVRLLLTAGAAPSLSDRTGKTPLILAHEQWALARGQSAFEDILVLLVAADPAAARADAELVAVCAANGSTRLLHQLSAAGADLARPDRWGWTPLDLAHKGGQRVTAAFLREQAAWVRLLPARWAACTRAAASSAVRVVLGVDGLTVRAAAGEHACVATDRPLPAGLDRFYFEVTSRPVAVVDGGARPPAWPEMAIGFCTLGGAAIRFPGWPPRPDAPGARSWGYHGDNGGLYMSGGDGTPEVTEPPYAPGMTVGAGVDLARGLIWFTRNGKRLAGKFENVQGRLFPLLGLRDAVELEANFRGPFMWKDEDSAKEKQKTIEVRVAPTADVVVSVA